RFFYDGRDGQGFWLSRQGNRSSAGDTTACSRVLNGHCIVVIPPVGGFHHQFVQGVHGSQQSASQLSGGGSRKRRLMSAFGHKRALEGLFAMSALPPKVNIVHHGRDVRFVPKADIRRFIRSPRRQWQVSPVER